MRRKFHVPIATGAHFNILLLNLEKFIIDSVLFEKCISVRNVCDPKLNYTENKKNSIILLTRALNYSDN